METSNNNGKLIGAALIGVAVGGALGILFAPEKGDITRKKFAGKSSEFSDAIMQRFKDFLKEIKIDIETEKKLNSKILEITMQIKDHYPELSKYIEEMEVTIPNENNPEITLHNLRTYCDSLASMFNKYKLEHPENIQQKLAYSAG